jgi:poly(A) polymerase
VPKLEKLFRIFEDKGKKLYFVGGCVRDKLMGREPEDWDFTTDAEPCDIKAILKGAELKFWTVGEKYGTISSKVDDVVVEITTHRQDMTSGRHPVVKYSTDLKLDLMRRDFTINSMAMRGDGAIIDPFGGCRDLKKNVIRCVGSASDRFSDDPLRILRAARFAARFGFEVESSTISAMFSQAHSVMSVSRERWLVEMNKLLVADHPALGLDILANTRVLWFIIPELWAVWVSSNCHISSQAKDLWHHTKVVVGNVSQDFILRWSALLHDIAKPQTYTKARSGVHFLQHEVLGGEIVEGIARRLKMSNQMRREIRGLVSLHQRVSDVTYYEGGKRVVSERGLRRLIVACEKRGCKVDDLLELFGADCSSGKQSVRNLVREEKLLIFSALDKMRKEIQEEKERLRLPKGIGAEIIRYFGLKPGPEVGEKKQILEQLLIDGKILSSDSLKKMCVTLESELKG